MADANEKEKLAAIEEMILRGMTYREISKELGVKLSTIAAVGSALGVIRYRLADMNKTISEMADSGATDEQIASAVGRAPSLIKQRRITLKGGSVRHLGGK